MRILQIIDSLEAGGAERMAVNYANALANTIQFSGLVVSRKEGPLWSQINNNVSYLFLNKKSVLDIQSVFKFRKFVIANKVEIIHAHSTSFFLAFLLKITYPTVKLIWHDHYGDSEFLNKRPFLVLNFVLSFFNGIIAVNKNLKIWAEQKLKFKNVVYLPNFPSVENKISKQTILQGIQGKRIVSLANLRVQKNHFLLLEVAKKIKVSHPEWTFHLVGKDFDDVYSNQIKSLILEYNLSDIVFIYGSRNDIKNILNQSEIGILTSQSEGLPVALLEYGLYEKSVVVTNVGEMPLVIKSGKNGYLIKTGSAPLFYAALVKLIESDTLRADFGTKLEKTIANNYSEEAVLHLYLKWLK
ncbi:glycosyltransferase [Flavobacterium sp.]|uniref:glycosyltransferase n=1 Tax=Flavobacterium sp. TaxID=239 RepID=UPI00286DC4F4|nr:glycosyltransferase [Flavobacterium sp.]